MMVEPRRSSPRWSMMGVMLVPMNMVVWERGTNWACCSPPPLRLQAVTVSSGCRRVSASRLIGFCCSRQRLRAHRRRGRRPSWVLGASRRGRRHSGAGSLLPSWPRQCHGCAGATSGVANRRWHPKRSSDAFSAAAASLSPRLVAFSAAALLPQALLALGSTSRSWRGLGEPNPLDDLRPPPRCACGWASWARIARASVAGSRAICRSFSEPAYAAKAPPLERF